MGIDVAEVHDLISGRMRESGQLYTKGRRQLVELLAVAGRPATIAELLEAGPRLTQSSLYRNMVDLESVGIVQRVVGTDDLTRFELSEEIIGHHHHVICTTCGAVDDFVVPAPAERSLDAAISKALEETGFQPTAHRLDVLGVCADCS
ncbi:Fur family transcriptional regulator [Nodularia spumigena]|uniref:Fur family transcriptional regulator n=1 Tax=Nodularia spumigena TaxID=70799 RepID=UPI002B20ECED|nr:Fur family transcriptional regulator [Nodularia spumigena]MEA5558020.1 Fur family transcriptional regulator [Nodularia spumigena CH309]